MIMLDYMKVWVKITKDYKACVVLEYSHTFLLGLIDCSWLIPYSSSD